MVSDSLLRRIRRRIDADQRPHKVQRVQQRTCRQSQHDKDQLDPSPVRGSHGKKELGRKTRENRDADHRKARKQEKQPRVGISEGAALHVLETETVPGYRREPRSCQKELGFGHRVSHNVEHRRSKARRSAKSDPHIDVADLRG